MIHLDTHVVVWLYAGQLERITAEGQRVIGTQDLRMSPLVVLEMQYLYEVGRITVPGQAIYDDLRARIGLELCDSPLAAVAASACALSWTRDPFDRLIAAQAITEQRPLLTADDKIRANLPLAIWP